MDTLADHKEFIVRQKVEGIEVFTGFETSNRYTVSSGSGEPVLYAYEESNWLARQFLATHRPLTFHFIDNAKTPVLQAKRGFFWLFSHLHVTDSHGQPLGSLQRRFAILKRKFSVHDPSGKPIAEIVGPLMKPNTFIVSQHDREVARVTKKWSGVLREMATDADTFHVQREATTTDPKLWALVLAAAFAIDMDFFESKGNRRSSPTFGR
ncbi:MAG: phospholipid scramblase-related protein [Chloroflexi bacterium]|nr:phospholipid scramblase-related protein [Chloroflexota bacterium]